MESEVLTFHQLFETSQRLDHFLVNQFPDLSRSYLQNLVKKGNVSVDGNIIYKTGYKLDGEREISIILPPLESSKLTPEPMHLDILFENKDVLVINKPAGIVVHPSAGHKTGTLVHGLLAYIPDLEGIGGIKRPGIVHRLDKETSGVLIIAKNDKAHRFLQEQFKQRQVKKSYLALVDSKPPTPTGRIEASVGRDPSHRQRMAIVPEGKGKLAISEYKTMQSFTNHTLLRITIQTGRTHQIRLHMAFLNCPVVGDRIYGYKTPSLLVKRHLLHAQSVVINLPDGTNNAYFEAPLPNDFQNVIERLT